MAFFLKAEADLTLFYRQHIRQHHTEAHKSDRLFPVSRYHAQLGQSRLLLAIISITVEQKAIMGVGSRRWHNTLSVEQMRSGQMTFPEYDALCSLRRHSAATARRDYNMDSRRERDLEGVRRFIGMAGVDPDPRSGLNSFTIMDVGELTPPPPPPHGSRAPAAAGPRALAAGTLAGDPDPAGHGARYMPFRARGRSSNGPWSHGEMTYYSEHAFAGKHLWLMLTI